MAVARLVTAKGPDGKGKLQVLKVLRASLAKEEKFVKMFLEEARLAALVSHRNVVETYEVGFDGQTYFIAMEYVEGQSVDAIVRKAKANGGEFALRLYLRVLIDALTGLHHAHELTTFDGAPLNIVHRDATPHNILVRYDGIVKIVDFGIAKAADSDEDTRTGIFKGKCGYMAPEQFGADILTRRADIFTIGVQLWQALTGERLWGKMGDGDILVALSQGHIRKPSAVKRGPRGLEAICMRALAFEPRDRFATALEFKDALTEYIANHRMAMSADELGNYVSRMFAEERAQLRDVIEAHFARSHTSTSVAPVVDATVSVPNVETAPAPSVRRKPPIWALAAGAIALSGLVVAVVAGAGGARRPSESATGIAPPDTRGHASQSLQTRLTVRGNPAQAAIYLDDVLLAGNPVIQSFPRDGAPHALRVEAPGHVTKQSKVFLDSSSVIVDVDLDPTPAPSAVAAVPLPARTAPSPAPLAPAPHAAPGPQAAPHAKTRSDSDDAPSKHKLDTTDPWSR
jgi:serine/threonine-protein kinase